MLIVIGIWQPLSCLQLVSFFYKFMYAVNDYFQLMKIQVLLKNSNVNRNVIKKIVVIRCRNYFKSTLTQKRQPIFGSANVLPMVCRGEPRWGARGPSYDFLHHYQPTTLADDGGTSVGWWWSNEQHESWSNRSVKGGSTGPCEIVNLSLSETRSQRGSTCCLTYGLSDLHGQEQFPRIDLTVKLGFACSTYVWRNTSTIPTKLRRESTS